MSCAARQDSTGDWRCHRCGTAWDRNDNDPPRCLTAEQLRIAVGNEWLKRIKQCLATSA